MKERKIFIGDSGKNKALGANKQTKGVHYYPLLLLSTVISEMTSFYTVYFFILFILQLIPQVSTTQAWTTILPLILYIGLSYLFQALDFHHLQKQAEINENMVYTFIRDHRTVEDKARNISPGDIIKISPLSPLPCDGVLISAENDVVFVNSSIIDGESEMKLRNAAQFGRELSREDLIDASGVMTVVRDRDTGEVNGELTIDFGSENTVATFDNSNIVERGSLIYSTDASFFMAVFTGADCKGDSGPFKGFKIQSRKTVVDDYIERIAITVFFIQLAIGILLGLLTKKGRTPLTRGGKMDFIIFILRNYLLLSFMIPITLKLILPLFRFVYGWFISNDENITDTNAGIHSTAYTTTVTENLGAVDYIISDKTGTLTTNELKLITVTIGSDRYGANNTSTTLFEDETLLRKVLVPEKRTTPEIIRRKMKNAKFFFNALAVCNTSRVDYMNGIWSSSSDETAIMHGLISLGWKFGGKTVKTPFGDVEMEKLRLFPLSRERQSVSAVARINNELYFFSLGALESILPRCTNISDDIIQTNRDYQSNRMRTLCFAYKQLTEYDESAPLSELDDGLTYLGILGLQDTLQSDVNSSIRTLKEAGIKLWIATGDARLNSLVTCCAAGVMDGKDRIYEITSQNLQDNSYKNFKPGEEERYSIIIDGSNKVLLQNAMDDSGFTDALMNASSILFYRCRPDTKANLALCIRGNRKIVMGVGDGANDSSLIYASDVGVGIISKENQHNFGICDFAVPSFKNLVRLILVHGHASLQRSILVVHFSFYKAFLFAMVQALYQTWTEFTGKSFFDGPALTMFNMVWTLIPLICVMFDNDVSDNFLIRLSSLYSKLRNPMTVRPSNLTWMYIAIYQAIVVMFIAYNLTGESFVQTRTGSDFGVGYLSLVVYFSLVCISSFYLVYQLNSFNYYSIVCMLGNIVLLISIASLSQTSMLRKYLPEWIGFFGECLNDQKTILMAISMFLAASIPSWVCLRVWEEFNSTETLIVIEKESIAAKADEPLFFDPMQ